MATTKRYMITGSMNIRPEWPCAVWKSHTVAPRVAPKPRPTEAIRDL
jgi:hypothetical protein